jgi:Ca2+/Na+ antiporter
MIQNIILIILIIILFFFISNEDKINDIFTRKYVKFLFMIIIIYFVYQNYNFTVLAIALLILVFLNVDIKDKISNNKYLGNYESFKNLVIDYYNNFKREAFSNNKEETAQLNNYDFTPQIPQSISDNRDDNENEKKIEVEPFKDEVVKLKDLYENIKMEITKLT